VSAVGKPPYRLSVWPLLSRQCLAFPWDDAVVCADIGERWHRDALAFVHVGESSLGSLVCVARYAVEHPRLERPGLYHVRGSNPRGTPFSCMRACASGPIACICGGAPVTGCVATVILLLQFT
jgi:hypothetical protein